jgi:hypothetical protein
MKESLDKLIKRLVLRKYPFIEDYEVKVDTNKLSSLKALGGHKKIAFERYKIIYILTPDENGEFPYDDEFKKLTEFTETLFKMLGPEHYQRLDDVEFYGEEN